MTSREEMLELADAIQSLADRKRKISGANCGIIVSVAKADAIVAALRSQAESMTERSRDYWQGMYTELLKRVEAGEFAQSPLTNAALIWALEYLDGYDHTGTGSSPPESFLRDYEEKLETIRVMIGKEREYPRWKLGDHFGCAAIQQFDGEKK